MKSKTLLFVVGCFFWSCVLRAAHLSSVATADELIQCIRLNNVAQLNELVQKEGVDVNVENIHGITPLLCAADCGNYACIEILLKQPGIIIGKRPYSNGRYFSDAVPFMVAARNGHEACIKLLLNHGDTSFNEQNERGWTALMSAARYGNVECVNALLEHPDIRVNIQEKNGWQALMFAARYGNVECVNALLERDDILVNMQEKNGYTALMLAVTYAHTGCIRALLKNNTTDINIKNNRRETAVMIAAYYGHFSCLREILAKNPDARNVDGYNSLMMFADAGYPKSSRVDVNAAAQELLTWSKTDVNAGTLTQEKDVDIAADCLYTAARMGTINRLKLLLNSRVNVNKVDHLGWTPLCHAASTGQHEAVKILLDAGADTDVVTESGFTAHMIADYFGHAECARTLSEYADLGMSMHKRQRT